MIEKPADESVIDLLAEPEGRGQDPDAPGAEISDLKMPEVARRGKIVLQHTTGPLAGMYRIVGCVADAPSPLPGVVDEVDMLSHHAPVSLIYHKPSHVLYREIADPDAMHFDEEQK